MRIHIDEDVSTGCNHTTFDIHMYDLSPNEYDDIRPYIDEWLAARGYKR